MYKDRGDLRECRDYQAVQALLVTLDCKVIRITFYYITYTNKPKYQSPDAE